MLEEKYKITVTVSEITLLILEDIVEEKELESIEEAASMILEDAVIITN